MLFNGEQIMTAGEIRRPAIGPIGEAARQPIHGAWAALGEASAALGLHEDHAITELVTALAEDHEASARTRAAVERLVQRHRLLAEEHYRQRQLLQEWILSQLTYKALYYQYSGQKPEAPNIELMREKEMVRRRIRDELHAGCDLGEPVGALDDSSHSPSRP